MGKPCIFLDRDGIINEVYVIAGKPYPPPCVEAVKLTDGIKEFIDYLYEKGYLCIVISNQPDVARGIQSWNEVQKINSFLQQKLQNKIQEFMICYHDTKDNCQCRKPKPGMLLEAIEKYNIDISHSFFVGDRWSDIEAGKNADCRTIFVNYNYREKQPEDPDFTVNSIKEIIKIFEENNEHKNIC